MGDDLPPQVAVSLLAFGHVRVTENLPNSEPLQESDGVALR